MAKILLLAIVIWLVILILKRYAGSITSDKKAAQNKPEDMVQCAQCGLHLPKSDSLLINNNYYCCEAHSRQTHAD